MCIRDRDDIEALVETEARAQLEMKQVREPLALKPLPKEYHDIFNYFIPVRGMRQQLETVLENERNCKKRNGTSITGNILITGEHGTGKTVLAIDVVKAIYQVKNKKDAKVGKITAKSLNNKKVADVMKKIRGGALVIEQAGSMSVSYTHLEVYKRQKLVFNFLVSQELLAEAEERYYPTARFKALITNYYEEHQGRLYEILNQEEEKDDAADQPDPGE